MMVLGRWAANPAATTLSTRTNGKPERPGQSICRAFCWRLVQLGLWRAAHPSRAAEFFLRPYQARQPHLMTESALALSYSCCTYDGQGPDNSPPTTAPLRHDTRNGERSVEARDLCDRS